MIPPAIIGLMNDPLYMAGSIVALIAILVLVAGAED